MPQWLPYMYMPGIHIASNMSRDVPTMVTIGQAHILNI